MIKQDIIADLGICMQNGSQLQFLARANGTVLLRAGDEKIVEVSEEEFRSLVAKGVASKPGATQELGFIPDTDCRMTQAMILHAIRRDEELRRDGHTAKKARAVLHNELKKDPRFSRYVPKKFTLRTIQKWKKKSSLEGKAALFPRTHDRGNRGARYDELFENVAWSVLEHLYLASDRISVGQLVPLVQKRYLRECAEKQQEPGLSGKRCLEAVIANLRVDDIIKARHDTETAKKLRLQAQFYHRVKLPFDLVEVDTTTADVFIVDADGRCAGRPTISMAIDAATGWLLAIRLTLDPASEALTVRTLKDVMTERGEAFFDAFDIQNRVEVVGVPQIISVDQGSENCGPHLSGIVANAGMEWADNIPGCPEKKPHVERFIRELNGLLHTLSGATTSKELPHRQRIEKGMLEAVLTLQELEAKVMKWAYDVYAMKVRRLIHSPLRAAESPTGSWKRLSAGAVLPMAPQEIAEIFMVQKTDRKVHRYGIEVEGVQFHSDELKALIQTIGAGATVDVRYDPGDIREIAVCHAKLAKPIMVPAKSEEIAAVSFAEARRAKKPSEQAKAADRDARATAAELALSAQKLAEERGRGKVTSLKSARAKERLRQKFLETLNRSKLPVGQHVSDVVLANQPTPKLPVRRPERRAAIETME